MTAFNTITVICDIILAFAGFLFAMAEFRKKRNEEARIKKETEMIGKMAKEIDKIDAFLKLTLNVKKAYDETLEMQLTSPKEIIERITASDKEFVEQAVGVEKSVAALYRELLRNESNFSLSYGFDRIINACRGLLLVQTDKKRPFELLLTDFIEAREQLINEYNRIVSEKDVMSGEDGLRLGNMVNKMYLSVVAIGRSLRQFRPYLVETKMKFEMLENGSEAK